MRRRVAATMLAAALAAGLTLLTAPGAAASSKATVLTANLSGAREVPGPGDPDGQSGDQGDAVLVGQDPAQQQGPARRAGPGPGRPAPPGLGG